VTFTNVFTINQIYHAWIHPLHHSPLSSPPPIPGIVSTDLIFPFTYTCIPYLYPPTPFPHIFPHPTSTNLLDRTCSALPFSNFVKEKKMTFVFKIAIQEVSLWYFHVYMYYNLNWFTPSIFLLSTLVPFFMVISTSLKIHSCIGSTSTIFTLWISLIAYLLWLFTVVYFKVTWW
jgi:hypothetical protein